MIRKVPPIKLLNLDNIDEIWIINEKKMCKLVFCVCWWEILQQRQERRRQREKEGEGRMHNAWVYTRCCIAHSAQLKTGKQEIEIDRQRERERERERE